jgi:hypothetical protein
MKKTARVVLLCLIAIAQVGMFAFAWRDHQQMSEMLWALRMDYKALALRADGLIIDFGLDPPLFAPVVLMFLVCLLLTIVLLADEARRGNG